MNLAHEYRIALNDYLGAQNVIVGFWVFNIVGYLDMVRRVTTPIELPEGD